MKWSYSMVIEGAEFKYGISIDVSDLFFENQYIGVPSSQDVNHTSFC